MNCRIGEQAGVISPLNGLISNTDEGDMFYERVSESTNIIILKSLPRHGISYRFEE